MISAKQAFMKAISGFPRFTNMRRRKEKSNIGKIIKSITEELIDIDLAYQEFADSFFLIHYIGKEDTVIETLYFAQVGDMEIDHISLPALIVTDSLEIFHNGKDFAYYCGGYLIFYEEQLMNATCIEYSYGDVNYKVNVEKQAIWNIFDEYALYFALEREENETNKELLARILQSTKRRPNSTEIGLKHSILNSLTNLDDSIQETDIMINTVNEENMSYEDKTFGSIGNKLQYFNGDIFRTKRFGFHDWMHNFKELDYASVHWDKTYTDRQDGVGYNDALKTYLLSDFSHDAVDITLDLYEKSSYAIKQYIKKNKLPISIRLNLAKCSNSLKPRDVSYKIVANTVRNIKDDPIYINCYKDSYGIKKYHIEDLLINKTELNDITVCPEKLKDHTYYKLLFCPPSDYAQMKITELNFTTTGKTISLLKNHGIFKLNNGILSDSNVKVHATCLNDLYEADKVKDTVSGLTLEDAAEEGLITIDLKGIDNKYVKIEHSCPMISAVNELELDHFILDGNQISSDSTDASFTLEMQVNSFYMRMQTGNCTVTKTIDGVSTTEIWYSSHQELIINNDKPIDIKIKVKKLGINPIVFDKIEYNHYTIETYLQTGKILTTAMGDLIPKTTDTNNKLFVKIHTHTPYCPVISFIHIGSKSTTNYETDVFYSDTNSSLSIKSTCDVSLLEVDSTGHTIKMIPDYKTMKYYYNDKYAVRYLYLNIQNMGDIKCVPAIKQNKNGSRIEYFLELKYGESIEYLYIEGHISSLIQTQNLNKLLDPSGSKDIYITKGLNGFLLKDSMGEEFVVLSRDKISQEATKFTTICPDDISVNYSLYPATVNHMTCDKLFDELYLSPKESQQYIAYNDIKVYVSETKTEIIDMFMPLIPENVLFCYRIENANKEVTVLFENQHDWSVGKKEILISTDINLKSTENYKLEVHLLADSFLLSNEIVLAEEYSINGIFTPLAEFMITPPERTEVVYTMANTEDIVYVEEDLFKKLQYAHIVSIEKVTIGQHVIADSEYDFISDEGIILWNSDRYVGEIATVQYRYKVPRSIRFTDIDDLYKLVDYHVSAYKKILSTTFKNVSDTIDIHKITELNTADKIMITCSNPNYVANLFEKTISILRISEEDKIAVKPGYYYDSGLEYYFFINPFNNLIHKFENITLINVDVRDGRFTFSQKSKNYLPDSAMYQNKLREICHIDFANKRIAGISTLGKITACNSYAGWTYFHCDLSLVKGINGLALCFDMNENGYAYLDITKYVEANSIISFKTSEDLIFKIGIENHFDHMRFSQANFISICDNTLQQADGYQYMLTKDLAMQEDSKYYLLVLSSGWIDDIIIRNHIDGERISDLHVKNIDRLGFAIAEKKLTTQFVQIDLSKQFSETDHILIDEHCSIETAANVAWDMTKVYEIKNSWASLQRENLSVSYDHIISDLDKYGTFTTDTVFIKNVSSVKNIVVKINDVLLNNLSGFDVAVYTSPFESGPYELISTQKRVNVFKVSQKLNNFIMVKVIVPPGYLVNSLQIFAVYREVSHSHLLFSQYKTGSVVTNILDADVVSDFKVSALGISNITNRDDFKIYIRGLRENDNDFVWTNDKEIVLDADLGVANEISFSNYRYFQIRVDLLKYSAKLTLSSLSLELI